MTGGLTGAGDHAGGGDPQLGSRALRAILLETAATEEHIVAYSDGPLFNLRTDNKSNLSFVPHTDVSRDLALLRSKNRVEEERLVMY